MRNNVIFQSDQLLLESELLRELVVSGRIMIVPAVYSLNTGEVTFMDPVTWEEPKPKATESHATKRRRRKNSSLTFGPLAVTCNAEHLCTGLRQAGVV